MKINIVKAIKAIFNRSARSSSLIADTPAKIDPPRSPASSKIDAPLVIPLSIQLDQYAYIAKHQKVVEEKALKLIDIYRSDFNTFFYRPEIGEIIRKELLPVLEPFESSRYCLDNDHWLEKHPFNFPGPFYTGESDTCATGHVEAPENVLYDSYTQEYIFKQPQSFVELVSVIDAAAVEVFDSYSCNGNSYWTYEKCKQWWKNKPQLLELLKEPEIAAVNAGREQLYIDYLNTTAETDLRRYCFFLENGYYPGSENTNLPSL